MQSISEISRPSSLKFSPQRKAREEALLNFSLSTFLPTIPHTVPLISCRTILPYAHIYRTPWVNSKNKKQKTVQANETLLKVLAFLKKASKGANIRKRHIGNTTFAFLSLLLDYLQWICSVTNMLFSNCLERT